MGVWEFYESLGESPRKDLSPVQQGVAAICDLRQEVNSGGFDGYFRNWGGDTAPVALDALPTALGEEWAGVLRDAMELFGPTYPASQREREALMDGLDRDAALEALDQRFFDLEGSTDADALLDAQLAS